MRVSSKCCQSEVLPNIVKPKLPLTIITPHPPSLPDNKPKYLIHLARNLPMAPIKPPVPSEYALQKTVIDGLSLSVPNIAAGLLIGTGASLLLIRSPGGSGRKVFACFGAGVGLGSCWAKTSLNVEELWKGK